MISYVMSCREQDCVVVLAPYPNNPNPVESFNIKTDFDLTGDGLVRHARLQLFFNCTLCPTGLKATMHSGLHKEVSLVYFSTFEPIDLTSDSIMKRAGVPMLHDSASNPRLPCLYICPVANVLGHSPFIPCFIGRNSHPTITYRFKDDRRIGQASADTQRDRGNGSRLYEVNIWMALRPGPPPDGVYRRGGENQGRAVQREQDQGGKDEEASRSEAAAEAGAAQDGGGAD
jgi:hypothetical protein